MGCKMLDVKAGIKKSIKGYLNDNGYRDWHWRNRSERMDDISKLIDKHFEKLKAVEPEE